MGVYTLNAAWKCTGVMVNTTADDETPDGNMRPVRCATGSLKRVAMTGAAWTLMGHGAGQGLRIGSHLVLAWLLDPAIFGVMVMVDVVLQGLKMFSDVGTGPSIIQHERLRARQRQIGSPEGRRRL